MHSSNSEPQSPRGSTALTRSPVWDFPSSRRPEGYLNSAPYRWWGYFLPTYVLDSKLKPSTLFALGETSCHQSDLAEEGARIGLPGQSFRRCGSLQWLDWGLGQARWGPGGGMCAWTCLWCSRSISGMHRGRQPHGQSAQCCFWEEQTSEQHLPPSASARPHPSTQTKASTQSGRKWTRGKWNLQ